MYNILFLLSTHIFDFYEAFASFFYYPLASIKCNCIVVICNCFVVDRLLYLFYNVYRDRSVHYAAERSDPVKKYNCLLALLVSVFLLLCACAQRQADQVSSPDALSSTPSSFSSTPSSVPTSSISASSVPATAPTTAPTQPTEPAPPIQLSTDWVTNREIVPFEDRFKEDVYFGTTTTRWFIQEEGNTFIRYALSTRDSVYPLAVWNYDSIIYEISCDRELTGYTLLIGDGLNAYLVSTDELIRVDLRTGASTTLLTRGNNIIFWQVYPCGKDTICIFEIDAEKNLRIFYRDLHSDAEKTLYEGVLPESSPYDYASNGKYAAPGNRGISFTPPNSTQGTFSWRMMNPAFYAASQKELENPDSQFKHHYKENNYSKYWENPEEYPIHLATCPALCDAIENAYDIPYRVEYTYNPVTGTLTEDYGIIDTCFYGSGYSHDHYDYENTREEPVAVLNSDPVDIPTITKLTAEQAEEALADEPDYYYKNTVLYSECGYGRPYWLQDGKFIKLADIECLGFISTQYYVYCFTTENTIVQISPDGSICNTIYTANAEMDDWFYDLGSIYVQDGNQVIRINIINGTRQALLECNGNIYIRAGGDDFGEISVNITQGLYYQQHFFNPDTGELEETDYL